MSKKSKISQNHAEKPSASTPEAESSKKPSGRRSTTSKKSVGAGKKKVAKAGMKEARLASSLQPTDEQIRMRAYFIGERRHRLGLAGDSHSDWLEAKRQLVYEIGAL